MVSAVEEVDSQPTTQPTESDVLYDFRVFRQPPRCCKLLLKLITLDCHRRVSDSLMTSSSSPAACQSKSDSRNHFWCFTFRPASVLPILPVQVGRAPGNSFAFLGQALSHYSRRAT
jgi:hypothetical protein